MRCKNCGAEIPAGSNFCIQCGQRAEQPMAPDAQAQHPYAPQPYPPGGAAQPPKKPLRKGTKALIFGGAGAVALAVALILVFTLGGGKGLLSGNTTQTKFVNENAEFFMNALGDFKAENASKAASQPFEYTGTVSADMGYGSADADMSIVYDKQALGISIDSEYSPVKLLLLEDTIYVENSGYVTAVGFDSDADLSKPMTLKDRLTAIAQSLAGDADYKALAEALVNSIPEECFEKSNTGFRMTLDMDALTDTLNNFADTLKENDEMDDAFSDLVRDVAGMPLDASGLADMAEIYGSNMDFKLVWELGYKGGKPASVTIGYEDSGGYSDFTLEVGYAKISGVGKWTVSLETAGGYSDFDFEMTSTKAKGGFNVEGSAKTSYDKIAFEGSVIWEGENFTFTFDADSDSGDTYSMEANGTLEIGMPKEAVEKDSRFEMDTGDAYEVDLADIFSSASMY